MLIHQRQAYVPEECIICDSPLPPAEPHCGRCGFPPALAGLVGSQLTDEPDLALPGPAVAPSTGAPASTEPAVDPEEEANAHFARQIRSTLEIVHDLSGECPEVIGELRQAALLEAEGRTSEALTVLRGAQGTATSRVAELFEQRLKEFEDRQQVLLAQGLAPEFVQDSLRLRAEFAEAPIEVVAEHLAEADRQLAKLEGDWLELRTMLRQADQMRLAARKLGHTFPPIEEELGRIRAVLTQPAITRAELDTAVSGMHRVIRTFHETLTPNLQEELDRHATHLAQVSPTHQPSRHARQMHAEANRHLQQGRLAEASFRLFELREAIDAAAGDATEAAPPDGGPATAGAVAPAADAEQSLSELLLRARELAGRIRALPAQSPIAESAAAQIHEATELLRNHRLAEAGQALTDLMRALDAQPGTGGP